ncbi:MAG: hypothetical protein WAL85_05540 [Candidatus Korobacteraceae bacterium]
MKTLKLISIGVLLLVSVATLSAQTSLPNPHDDACWSSLGALRACQIQAYDQAVEYAQRCTSYPEYQCNDYYQAPAKSSSKSEAKAALKATQPTPRVTANSAGTADASLSGQ